MFKYYLTRASDYIISAKILVLLAIYSVFTIGIKIDALRSGLSYWEYILLAMQNMRYIILILCVVFILFLMVPYNFKTEVFSYFYPIIYLYYHVYSPVGM